MASPAPPTSASFVLVVHPLPSHLLPAKPSISTFSPTSVIEIGAAMDRFAELTEDTTETSSHVSQSHHVSIESNSEFDFRSKSSGSDQEEVKDYFMDREGTGPLTHRRAFLRSIFVNLTSKRTRSDLPSSPSAIHHFKLLFFFQI
ncbi:hypothetical protein FCM35_KLT06655 [Carex littledalei]|uniref:Uncharacterized protein n=1 Tax=Carex littledalei TaxID=544730 RepID=A0A833VLR4_9POAL|nr:hypothetical protein FCM35_KLT06655 [Carex littledalei]